VGLIKELVVDPLQTDFRYQLILMGPFASMFERLHETKLLDAMLDLGVDSNLHLRVLPSTHWDQFDPRASVVGVWYGGSASFAESTDHERMLTTVFNCGATVIPLVKLLSRFSESVPPELGYLRSINGLEWNDERVVSDILKGFGLTRRQRQAFVSYKRTDSESIARQVAHMLFDRGYQVFLDTASVERGVPFQDVLRDRLADTDLVVLLDSPNALDSKWVHEELDLVHQLGIGVLQLFWTRADPNNPSGLQSLATKGTELATERFPLESHHFLDPSNMLGDNAYLTSETLKSVADKAERARIRSLGSRRNRVISGLRAELVRKNLDLQLCPPGLVSITRDGRTIATAYTVAGLPDALLIDEHEARIAGNRERRAAMERSDFGPYRLVYDGLGILNERLHHLSWLNQCMYLKSVSTEGLDEWLAVL
jgi:hypothetical protein